MTRRKWCIVGYWIRNLIWIEYIIAICELNVTAKISVPFISAAVFVIQNVCEVIISMGETQFIPVTFFWKRMSVFLRRAYNSLYVTLWHCHTNTERKEYYYKSLITCTYYIFRKFEESEFSRYHVFEKLRSCWRFYFLFRQLVMSNIKISTEQFLVS